MQITKKWKILIRILVLVNIVIVGIILIKGDQEEISPTSLAEIVPGKTTTEQISNIPNLYHQQTTAQGTKTYFGNNAPKQYSEVVSKDNIVIAYKKTHPNSFEFKTLNEYMGKYGSTSWIVTTESQEFGFKGYVYKEAGLIVFAHETSKEVIEEWIVEKNVTSEIVQYLFPTPTQKIGH